MFCLLRNFRIYCLYFLKPLLTHGINIFGDNLFLFKLTLVETTFFAEQILPEYSCSTSENFKLSPQHPVLISEKIRTGGDNARFSN